MFTEAIISARRNAHLRAEELSEVLRGRRPERLMGVRFFRRDRQTADRDPDAGIKRSGASISFSVPKHICRAMETDWTIKLEERRRNESET